MKVLVGTASWSDKSLVASKTFYPPEASTPERRLRFYATRFPLVEVDTSYYAVPTVQAWADRTPAHFAFDIKSFRLFTGHATSPRVMPPDLRGELPKTTKTNPTAGFYWKDLPPELRQALWRRFREAIEPLRASGKLGMVHFQFAPWLLRNRSGHAHVAACVEAMQGYTVSVEFRNRTWFDDAAHVGQTLAFERELNVVHTIVDGPQGFYNSVPPVWESTHIAYSLVRLHGRNHETWNAKVPAASGRFDYDYPDAELDGLAARVERLAPETFTTHVILNNNNGDQGQRNAASLTRILESRRRARVPKLVASASASASDRDAAGRPSAAPSPVRSDEPLEHTAWVAEDAAAS